MFGLNRIAAMKHSVHGLIKLSASCALALGMAACSTGSLTDDVTLAWTPDKLYAQAKSELDSGTFETALKTLEKLESRYPFGRWAQQAQIDTAYAHYKQGDQVAGLLAVDRFMRLHPNHESIDYAHYLKGLINFNENRGFFANWGGQDLSERDLKAAREAYDAFRELSVRFPTSKYAPDSLQRMGYLLNSIAQGEVHIARFYFLRGAHLAAANRAQAVVKQFDTTPAVEEALYIMVRSYEELGLTDLSDAADRVLRKNYPKSEFYLTGLKRETRSWWQVWR
jgi:outer membrane protein assembly factor BamD